MDKKLAKKIDAYTKKHLAPWDFDEQGQQTEECKALDVYNWLVSLMGEDLDRELEKEIRIECYKEALKADQTFFDDADTGYCPDTMIDGWGDVYLGKGSRLKEILSSDDAQDLEDDCYYLADCTEDPTRFYKVERA